MINYKSNIITCQLKLLETCDSILQMVDRSRLNLLQEVNMQSVPLLYEMHIEDFVKTTDMLIKQIYAIREQIKEIQ